MQNQPPVVTYLPFEERTRDYQFRDLVEQILTKGRTVHPIQGGEARMIVGAQFHFNMANGAPVINLRDLSGLFHGAISEEIGFLNGAQTLEELVAYGLNPKWWAPWVTKEKCAIFGLSEGDLGPASYGGVWTRFPKRDGGTFNQIDAVIEQMKRAPHLRTHRISNWYPPEIFGPPGTRKVVVSPCHGDVHVLLDPERKELILHHVQHKGDLLVGVVFNMIQYTALGMELAQILGYTFVDFVQTFSDVHLYGCQYQAAEELIAREPFPFPTITLEKGITNIHDFRAKHFMLSDYVAHPKMNIPTPV